MEVYIVVRRSGSDVEKAVIFWATRCEWPRWFAKNIVLWRKKRGLWWQTCGEPVEVRLG